MNPQDVTHELDHRGARDLLNSATLLRLGYNGSDDFPRVIPIGFHWDGGQIVICTARPRPRWRRWRHVRRLR
jgi:nitroimidazol reductase NimA-like FMN-containing flavoprotein (pyridoxamine 5'-phosphate oxidase superfamily)